MRRKLILCLALLGLSVGMVQAEEVLFEGGRAVADWDKDSRFMNIEAWIEAPTSDRQSHTWIVTVYSHRFEDGLFAWQLHYSEDIDSVLVLPNDFLTARNFTTSQLGIEATLSDTGDRLSLRVPALGAIPNLIAAGDHIEIHALWIQQSSLVSLTVPIPGDALASLPEGGGGSHPGPEDEDVVPTSLIPDVSYYIQGEAIAHCFALDSSLSSHDSLRIVLSYTLMRVHHDQASEFVRFAHIPFNSETETYAYSINTDLLSPGLYRLLIDSANSPVSARMDLEIVAQTPPQD